MNNQQIINDPRQYEPHCDRRLPKQPQNPMKVTMPSTMFLTMQFTCPIVD